MGGYEIQLSDTTIDEKIGYERHPLSIGVPVADGEPLGTNFVPLVWWDVTPEIIQDILDAALNELDI